LNNQEKNSKKASNPNFPVVGIGAPAGGFEPLRLLLENLPIDTGMAFVVIQHLLPGQSSMLQKFCLERPKCPFAKLKTA
jgi:two-component system, chemotaxis family, CheB/CheR fusion protein